MPYPSSIFLTPLAYCGSVAARSVSKWFEPRQAASSNAS